MALNGKFLIANPTNVKLETADKAVAVEPGHVLLVTADVEAHPQYLAELISKGCVVGPGAVNNASGAFTGKLDNLTTLVEKGTRLLGAMTRAVTSAGTDAWAAKGL